MSIDPLTPPLEPAGDYEIDRSRLIDSAGELERRRIELERARRSLESELAERERAVVAHRESEAWLNSLIAALPDLVWTANPDGSLDYMNAAFQEYLGMTPEGFNRVGWAGVSHSEDASTVALAFTAYGEHRPFEVELRLRGRSGEYRWFWVRCVPMHAAPDDPAQVPAALSHPRLPDAAEAPESLGAPGSVPGLRTGDRWLGVMRDITERKQAEQALKTSEMALREYANRLERSNRDLQEFAFIASHDLQEPLRKIDAFGRALVATGSNLTESQSDYLERMRKAAKRMGMMISDLLALARIGSQGEDFTAVDLNETVNEVLADLEIQIQGTGARVEIGLLPVIEADAIKIRQVLQNLILNALKFQPPDGHPVVKIYVADYFPSRRDALSQSASEPAHSQRAERLPASAFGRDASEPPDASAPLGSQGWLTPPLPAEATVRIVVEDNGIGFDPSMVERIFQPFQRLVGKSQFAGSGMGLAICRKIIERHGGSLTATGEVNHGAKFTIELPLKQSG